MRLSLGAANEFTSAQASDSIAISLSEPDGQNASWQLDVYAETDEGRVWVGSIDTISVMAPAAPGDFTRTRPSRCVAWANFRGVRGWAIQAVGPPATATAIKAASTDISGELRIHARDLCCADAPLGVFRPSGGTTILNGGRPSPALGFNRVDAIGPTSLLATYGSNEGPSAVPVQTTPRWLMFFNSPVPVVNGTVPWQGLSFNVPAGGSFSFNAGTNGIFFPLGMYWAISTTPGALTQDIFALWTVNTVIPTM